MSASFLRPYVLWRQQCRTFLFKDPIKEPGLFKSGWVSGKVKRNLKKDGLASEYNLIYWNKNYEFFRNANLMLYGCVVFSGVSLAYRQSRGLIDWDWCRAYLEREGLSAYLSLAGMAGLLFCMGLGIVLARRRIVARIYANADWSKLVLIVKNSLLQDRLIHFTLKEVVPSAPESWNLSEYLSTIRIQSVKRRFVLDEHNFINQECFHRLTLDRIPAIDTTNSAISHPLAKFTVREMFRTKGSGKRHPPRALR